MSSALGCALTAAALFALPAAPAERDRDRREDCHHDCRGDSNGDRKGNRYCFMPCDFTIIIPPPGQDRQEP